jgi:hypothetical protein
MRHEYYRLDGKAVVPCNQLEWSRRFKLKNRIVAQTYVGDVHVSTVFIGLDHSWGDGPPLLFETMIFGGPHDGYQKRCSTWQEAEGMHSQAMKLAKREADAE